MQQTATARFGFLCVCLTALTIAAFSQTSHHDVVIKNATVMTVTHGNIKNGSIYIKDGKIAAVGDEPAAGGENRPDVVGTAGGAPPGQAVTGRLAVRTIFLCLRTCMM